MVRKPTPEAYLRLAEMYFERMQKTAKALDRPLKPDDASFRFIGRQHWFYLMLWAGFPITTSEDCL